MSSRFLLALAVIAAAGTRPSSAQQLQNYGDWVDRPGAPTVELYVDSAAGSDANNGLLPFGGNTLATIGRALALADTTYAGSAVTINCFPGGYGPLETFPLNIPAHGIALETYRPPASGAPGATRARIVPGFDPETIVIDRVGDTSLPDTVLHGLEVLSADGGWAVVIEPSRASTTPEPTAVEIRECWVHTDHFSANGVQIVVNTGWTATHVLEKNRIGCEFAVFGYGVQVMSSAGISSTLFRSNEIHLWENPVWVSGFSGFEDDMRPRFFSNCIEVGEKVMLLENCNPILLNNTVAFAITYSGAQAVIGLEWTGTGIVLGNNNFWNPDEIDVSLYGSILRSANNNDEDGLIGNRVLPQFVGGDSHPGHVRSDLHLTAGSGLIDAGDNAQIADLTNLPAPFLFEGGYRVDVNFDVDCDPRMLASTAGGGPLVDIGCDEFSRARMVPAAHDPMLPGTSIDAFGNLDQWLIFSGGLAYRTTVDLTGPPNGGWALYLGFGFYDDPVMQNTYPLPWGNIGIDLTAGTSVLLATGNFDAAGNAAAPVDLGGLPPGLIEAELYLQARVARTGSTPAASLSPDQMTNRMRIELNL